MKTKLDAAVVAAAECPPNKRRLDIYCTHNRGLLLEVRPSGGKTYHVRYTDQHGATKQLKVARADQVTFEQARKAARQLIAEAALGHDPAAKKQERKAVPLYADLSAQHMADAKLHLKSYPLMRAMMRRHILSRWGNVRLTDIDSRAVAQWLADKRAAGLKPATVEKIYGRQRVRRQGARVGRRQRGMGTQPLRLRRAAGGLRRFRSFRARGRGRRA